MPLRGRADSIEVDLIANDFAEAHDAIFEWVDSSSITNARLLPFLQISGVGVAGDYNRKKSARLQDIPVVTLNGTNYLQFAMDVQGAMVSLDTVEIFTAGRPTFSTSNLGFVGIKRWDLDKICWDYSAQEQADCNPSWDDVVVQIDPHRNIRQSGIDMFLYVPMTRFSDVQPQDYVYLFCVFGNPQKPVPSSITMYPKGAGAAKWGILKPLPVR